MCNICFSHHEQEGPRFLAERYKDIVVHRFKKNLYVLDTGNRAVNKISLILPYRVPPQIITTTLSRSRIILNNQKLTDTQGSLTGNVRSVSNIW